MIDYKQKIVLLIALIALCCACATIYESFDRLNLLSDEEERELGGQVKSEVEAQNTVLNDPEVTAYVQGLGQQIAPHLPERSFGYEFKVLDSEMINAFATPGGYCYVYTGLIRYADNESELAAVIAHECSHVAAEHIGRQLTKQYTLDLLLKAALGSDPSVGAQIASSLGGAGVGLAYSRSNEFEADRYGAGAMYEAGYNPRGMVTFFEKLEKEHESDPSLGNITKYFSTHPPTGERIAALRAQIAEFDLHEGLIVDSQEFHRIQAKLEK